MRHHIRSVCVLALCAAGMMVHAAAATAQDDMEKPRDDAKKRMLWKLGRATDGLKDAENMLRSIASSEALILGQATHPGITTFRDHFSHPTLIKDYVRFERSSATATPAGAMLAPLEPLAKRLAALKDGIEADVLTPRDVEDEREQLEIPDTVALAPRRHTAADLVRRAEALTPDQLAETKPLAEALKDYHAIVPPVSNADIDQRIRDEFPGQHMERILDAEKSFGHLMSGTAEPTAEGYVTWIYVAYCYLRTNDEASSFGIPSRAFGKTFKLTDFRNEASAPRLVEAYIKWFGLAQGYSFHTGLSPMTPDDARHLVTKSFNNLDRSDRSRAGTTFDMLAGAFTRYSQADRNASHPAPQGQ